MAERNDRTRRQGGARDGQRAAKKTDTVPLDVVSPQLLQRVLREQPQLAEKGAIDRLDLARHRAGYVEDLLRQERGELSDLDRRVAESMTSETTLAANVEHEYSGQRTFGEQMADNLARFGGSWTFIIVFSITLAVWITFNARAAGGEAFDPYPFILLNLVLSCLAAVQAPIIMMSQKRQEAKDRLRSSNDYLINLKAELEIRHLHEKIDHLLTRQWQRLTELQTLQIELMEEISTLRGK